MNILRLSTSIFLMLAFLLTACGDNSSPNAIRINGIITIDLSDKVWFVVGDSFSHGDWRSIVPEPKIKSGKYAGKLPVYSYLIGNRTEIDVRNIAENGYSLSMREGIDSSQAFTHPKGKLYTTDFSEADIITIYIGINDSHNYVPIGSLDGYDTYTFFGAWNTTIAYLKEHYPSAKIGLIVSNDCLLPTYPEATVSIAEKWDLPYLDLDKGVNGTTMLLSSSRNPTSEKVKEQILKEQRVSTTNNHPNELAHQIESVFIEEWLRSIL